MGKLLIKGSKEFFEMYNVLEIRREVKTVEVKMSSSRGIREL